MLAYGALMAVQWQGDCFRSSASACIAVALHIKHFGYTGCLLGLLTEYWEQNFVTFLLPFIDD